MHHHSMIVLTLVEEISRVPLKGKTTPTTIVKNLQGESITIEG